MTPDLQDARWRKSSFSGGTNGNCVELTYDGDGAVRDSKNPYGAALRVDVGQLVRAIKQFDR